MSQKSINYKMAPKILSKLSQCVLMSHISGRVVNNHFQLTPDVVSTVEAGQCDSILPFQCQRMLILNFSFHLPSMYFFPCSILSWLDLLISSGNWAGACLQRFLSTPACNQTPAYPCFRMEMWYNSVGRKKWTFGLWTCCSFIRPKLLGQCS